ncbi:MAG: sn-glycerol-1-phosphate dehydrogenase [Betaproteobacteria bacterium]
MNHPGLDLCQSPLATIPDALGQLLRGAWLDPESGLPIGVPVLAVAIERSLAGMEAELVAPLPLGRRFAVVSDATTQRVLGARVTRAVASLGAIVPVVLGAKPHADAETAERLRRACAAADTLVAVGSGTINDLCKYAAAKDGKPYIVFATAPSMNGYASMNAALTVNGHKKTLPAAAPLGVFVDLKVLAAAPARMIQAGLGDSLCRSTAQADWLLSKQLLGTPYRHAPFALLAADEPALLESPEALLRGDLDAMRALARTLVLSGLGMTICHGSHPASQGEHLISHYIDMFAPDTRAAFFHGEQVAVATLTMARIQETMLAGPPPRVASGSITREDLQRRFGADTGHACWSEYSVKRLTEEAANDLSARIAHTWDATCAALRRVMIPAATIAEVMARAGCPRTPGELGVTPEFYARAVHDARFLRDRYTFLDLAADAGRLAALQPA